MRTRATIRPAPTKSRPPLLLAILTVLLAILGTAGCATVSGEPFSAFAASAQQLRDGADASLGAVHERIRNRYIAEAAAADFAKIDALLFTQPSGDPFGWASPSPNPPLFLQAARFREGVYRLNSVLVSYGGLLAQLASPDLVKPETFDQLATDLNGNLKTAVQALGVQAQPNKEIAIFSTLATGVFRAYLQDKQRSTLLKALQENQATIEHTAELGASAVRITAAAIRSEYDLESKGLAQQKAIKELVELDERFIKEIAGLRMLHQSYEALPAAHRELAIGLVEPQRSLPMIQELYENGRDLFRLYEQLTKEDKKNKEGGAEGGS
jgi:hypothetical protein